MNRWKALTANLLYLAHAYLGFAYARVGELIQTRSPVLNIHIAGLPNYTRLFRLMDRIPCKDLMQRRLLEQPKGAYILPLRLNLLEDLLEIEKHLPEDIRTRLKIDPYLRVMFDLSGEAVIGKELEVFHADLKRLGIPSEKICLLNANASKIFYAAWQQKHAPDYPICYIGYHFHIYAMMHKIAPDPWFMQHRARILTAGRRALEGTMRPKHFMALNWRARPHRTALLLYLLEKGHLPKGHVSYLGDYDCVPEHREGRYEEAVQKLLSKLPRSAAVLAQKPNLAAMTPLVFERDNHAMKAMHQTPTGLGFIIPELKLYPNDIRIDSYFEVVTETYMHGPEALYITEKTLRPLLRLQPFIYFGPPYMLREMRRLGFKTFAQLIDESYDEIEDSAARFAAACAELCRLCNLPLEELHRRYALLWPVLEHNFNHLCDEFSGIFAQDVENNVLKPLG